ncbi:MAG: serine hydrolase [Pseudomonadota bacterium]
MIRLLLAICVLATPLQASEAVIDVATGRLIAGWEENAPRFPASTTKLMTILTALEAVRDGEVKLDQTITVSAHAAAAPPVHLGLAKGAEITLAQAIHAALVLSSNDAARVIADAVDGDEATFARRMTALAHGLGMKNTVFRNASGLPDPGHVSTAADIARLIMRADQLHGPYLRDLFRKPLSYNGVSRAPRNNSLAAVEGAVLGKTGFTCAAGYTAALLVERAGQTLALATMANSASAPRAASLRRLAAGVTEERTFKQPCGGEVTAETLDGFGLTLGVFEDRTDARTALRESRSVVARADRVVAVRASGRGYYAMLQAPDRVAAEKLRRRLRLRGLSAELIDPEGRRLLGLTFDSRL